MDYEQIKRRFTERGLTIRGLARKLGVSHTHVITVLSRRHVSARTEKAVAKELGLDLKVLFPDRYGDR